LFKELETPSMPSAPYPRAIFIHLGKLLSFEKDQILADSQ
jgi:hypothetical protein